MTTEEKDYSEVDKAMSKEILKEFKGEIVECDCPTCKGKNSSDCQDCQGQGFVAYEY